MPAVKPTELDQYGLKWNKMLEINDRNEVWISMAKMGDEGKSDTVAGFEVRRLAARGGIGYNGPLINAKHCFDKDPIGLGRSLRNRVQGAERTR